MVIASGQESPGTISTDVVHPGRPPAPPRNSVVPRVNQKSNQSRTLQGQKRRLSSPEEDSDSFVGFHGFEGSIQPVQITGSQVRRLLGNRGVCDLTSKTIRNLKRRQPTPLQDPREGIQYRTIPLHPKPGFAVRPGLSDDRRAPCRALPLHPTKSAGTGPSQCSSPCARRSGHCPERCRLPGRSSLAN